MYFCPNAVFFCPAHHYERAITTLILLFGRPNTAIPTNMFHPAEIIETKLGSRASIACKITKSLIDDSNYSIGVVFFMIMGYDFVPIIVFRRIDCWRRL